jgi:hypothetical protein
MKCTKEGEMLGFTRDVKDSCKFMLGVIYDGCGWNMAVSAIVKVK